MIQQTAFSITYLIGIVEGLWNEDFYQKDRLGLFIVLFPTIDTYVTALVAKGTQNPN